MEKTPLNKDENKTIEVNGNIFKGSVELWEKILSEFNPETARWMTEEDLKNKIIVPII